MKKIGLLICFFVVQFSFAQKKITVSGYIEDQTNNEKLIGAAAVDIISNKGTTSNIYGFYGLSIEANILLEIKFSYLGYQPKTFQIKVTKDTIINCKLISNTVLKEVIISAAKQERIEEKTEMSRINIPIETIKNIPALFGEVDVLKALQLLPGVQKGGEGTTGIYVRGGGPDQNLILLDGVPIYNPNHLFGFFSIFNADAISNVELIKGGFPARYGGRLSSVIDITMKDGDNQNYHGTFGIGLIASRLTVEGPIAKDKASFIISGRRTYIDILAQPFIKKQSGGAGAGIYFYDFNAKLNWRINEKNRLFLSGYTGDDKVYGEFKDDYNYDNQKYASSNKFGLTWGNKTAALRWNNILTNKLFLNTSLTYTKYRYEIKNDVQSQRDSAGLRVEDTKYLQRIFSGIQDYAGRINLDYRPNNNHFIRFGTTYIYHIFSPGSVQTKITANTAKQDTTTGASRLFSNEASLYIEDDWKVFDKFSINAGLHQAYFNVSGKNYFSLQPRISANYRLPYGWALKASYATMTQYLHLLSNQGIGLPTDLWVPVTNKILPQRSVQYALGIARTVADIYEFSVEGYYKDMFDVIEYKEGVSNFVSSNDWENRVTRGKGKSFGGEVFLQRKFGKTTGWVGYTISKTTRQFDEKNLGKWYAYKFDRRHDIGITIQHTFSKVFDIAASWVYGTGNSISLPSQSYSAAPDFFTPSFGSFFGGGPQNNEQTIKYYEQLNNVRMRAYHRMDIGFNLHKVKKFGIATWNVSFYNAYNRQNPYFYYQGYNDAGKERIFQISLFPVLPSLSYNFKF